MPDLEQVWVYFEPHDPPTAGTFVAECSCGFRREGVDAGAVCAAVARHLPEIAQRWTPNGTSTPENAP